MSVDNTTCHRERSEGSASSALHSRSLAALGMAWGSNRFLAALGM